MFSHDGLRDSLTHVAAPPYFYESLKREISLSERHKYLITAIVFRLTSSLPIYDYSIVTFTEIVNRSIRLEDHFTRIASDTFVVLITGDLLLAQQVTSRICALWTLEGIPDISLHFAWISHQKGENSLDFLNRLDRQEMKSETF
jgi:GGDEF domain-containing protein